MSIINTYTYTIFNDLITKYPTWKALKSYLESAEGGWLNILDTNKEDLCIIRYIKGVSDFYNTHVPYFRSVVWDTINNIPVCVAPIKAENDVFNYTIIEECINNGVVCEEFIDGFMINIFKRVGDDNVYVCTRSKLDATGRFYSLRSFKELFIESFCNTYNVNIDTFNDYITNFITASNTSDNNEYSLFHSFVVQHPEHRVVQNIIIPRVYSVLSGTVYKDGSVSINKLNSIPKIEYSNMENMEVSDFVKRVFLNKSWGFQGIVFTDKNGKRWRYRSDKYTFVKSMRGNTPFSVVRYSQLMTQNLLKTYLDYYPEDKMLFEIYSMYYNFHICNIFDMYKKLHVYKSITREDISKHYIGHIYNIHGHYLTDLRPNNKVVTLNDVCLYMYKQPWQRIAHLMNSSLNVSPSQVDNIIENTE